MSGAVHSLPQYAFTTSCSVKKAQGQLSSFSDCRGTGREEAAEKTEAYVSGSRV